MTSAALVQEKEILYEVAVPKAKLLTWMEFKSRYLWREDSYKYEWINGTVEKSKRNMDQSQFFILSNLMAYFRQSDFVQIGELITEGDMFFAGNHRRPDVCFLTKEQITRAAYGENQVPKFVIEIISDSDGFKRVNKKMQDYRNAGVECVWYIIPDDEEIHIFSSSNLRSTQICKENDVCFVSFEQLKGFTPTVNQIFYKAEKPF